MKDTAVHLALIILFAIIIRWAISLHPYSGAGKPPMHGDYEAQRHWMEITFNLPVEDWYHNTTDNDLQYWGLDYPPLTAYHSLALGIVSDYLNESWVTLHKSRGIESYDHKLFMRYTVLIVDLLIYLPATFVYFLFCSSGLYDRSNQLVFCTISLLYPGLMLIDYGHFQYNCVSLGFALWGVIGLCTGHDLLGSVAFVLALNYKQMELYHAVPFFCYLLGRCIAQLRKNFQDGVVMLLKISAVVLVAFFVCWIPFLRNWEQIVQVLHRLFPFSRGLFEDKVANVWCSLSLVIKFKQIFEIPSVIKICLMTTLLCIIPSSLDLLFRPSISKFKYSLVNSSLIFFLFSFQVHEKSILIVALPISLLLPEHFFACMWFLLISTFSMLPLLVKDGLVMAYLASTTLFYLMCDILTCDEFQKRIYSGGKNVSPTSKRKKFFLEKNYRPIIAVFGASVTGMMILTALLLAVEPPERYPDLFPLGISAYSCVHFLLFLVYFHWHQFQIGPNRIPSESNEGQKIIHDISRKKKTK